MSHTPSFDATVAEITETWTNSGIFSLQLILNGDFSADPGQFVLLEPGAERSVQPRPFSVYNVLGRHIWVVIKVIGSNTRAYSKLRRGDHINVVGPQGSAIEIDEATASYILVGGGVGGVPLSFLAQRLRLADKKFLVILGGRDRSQIIDPEEFRMGQGKVCVITEKPDSVERTGLVTDPLAESLAIDSGKSTVIACGPLSMLHAVKCLCAEHGNPCRVILEERMACGSGSCHGCSVFGVDGAIKYVCSDGPCFDADWLDWSKLLQSSQSRSVNSPNTMPIEGLKTVLHGQGGRSLSLEYPIINASGCLGIDAAEANKVDLTYVGAVETKTVTVPSLDGNSMPRTCETPAGMINAIGLAGVGLAEFKRSELHRWLGLNKKLLVNISGFTVEEFMKIAKELRDACHAALVINISCPNVEQGRLSFGLDPDSASQVVRAVREVDPNRFIIVKLTPAGGAGIAVSVARAVKEVGADAIALINTIPAMAIDPWTLRPKIGTENGCGGLSGPAVLPIAVQMVRQVRLANLGIPIIGMGGIDSGEAAAQHFIAGADAVSIGTASFANRNIFSEVADTLCRVAGFHGHNFIVGLVGSCILSG